MLTIHELMAYHQAQTTNTEFHQEAIILLRMFCEEPDLSTGGLMPFLYDLDQQLERKQR